MPNNANKVEEWGKRLAKETNEKWESTASVLSFFKRQGIRGSRKEKKLSYVSRHFTTLVLQAPACSAYGRGLERKKQKKEKE